MQALWSKISKAARGRSARGVAQISIGTIVGQSVVVLVSPVLTRLYSPEEFGVLGIYTAITAVVAILASLRYDQAIPVAPGEDRNALFVLSAYLLVATSLVGLVVLTTARPLIVGVVRGDPTLFIALVPIGIFAIGLYQLLSAWAIREERYKVLGQTKVTQGVGMAAVQVAAGYMGGGAAGLLVGDLVGRGSGVGSLSRLLRNDVRDLIKVRAARLREVALTYRDYPTYIGTATLFSSASLYLPFFALQGIYGARTVGWFLLVQRIVSTPTSVLGKAVASVFYGRASAERRAGKSIIRLFRKGVLALFLIGLPVTILLALVAEPLFVGIFGSEWGEAGTYLIVMTPAYLANFTVIPFSQVFNIVGDQKKQTLVDSIRFVLCSASFGISYIMDLDAIWAVGMYSLALSMSYIFHIAHMWSSLARADLTRRK